MEESSNISNEKSLISAIPIPSIRGEIPLNLHREDDCDTETTTTTGGIHPRSTRRRQPNVTNELESHCNAEQTHLQEDSQLVYDQNNQLPQMSSDDRREHEKQTGDYSVSSPLSNATRTLKSDQNQEKECQKNEKNYKSISTTKRRVGRNFALIIRIVS